MDGVWSEDSDAIIDWESLYEGKELQIVGASNLSAAPDVSDLPQGEIEALEQ